MSKHQLSDVLMPHKKRKKYNESTRVTHRDVFEALGGLLCLLLFIAFIICGFCLGALR